MSLKKGGFGYVYQDVTRNKNISAAAKGLYAYLSSFCGVSNECYPSVDTITKEMGMTKDTFYKHINALVAVGVVKKDQEINNGKFGRTLYKLTHEVEIHSFSFPNNSESNKPISNNSETNINNAKINNINKNKNNISSEPDKSAPNPSGIMIQLNDKSFYDVPLEKIALWEETYPAVDIRQELKKMVAWCDSNPTKRKTRRGIERFINNWLSRTQDSGGTRGKEKVIEEERTSNTYNTDDEWENIKRAVAETRKGNKQRNDIFT